MFNFCIFKHPKDQKKIDRKGGEFFVFGKITSARLFQIEQAIIWLLINEKREKM